MVEYAYKNTLSRDVLVEKENNESDTWQSEELQARVFEDENCIKLFSPIPSTKTQNPTKSQAKELIGIALRKKKK